MIAAATEVPRTTLPLRLEGDNMEWLKQLPAKSVQCVVTSPPYYKLRDYTRGDPREHGLEDTPEEYILRQASVGREIKRVLRDDGIYWLNIGDSYGDDRSLMMIPERTAWALKQDGWIIRSDVIWHKTRGKPSSVHNRPVTNHEYIYMLVKGPDYYYDHVATQEELSENAVLRARLGPGTDFDPAKHKVDPSGVAETPFKTQVSTFGSILARGARDMRTVWSMSTANFGGGHFAVFPEELPRRCILSSTSEKGACAKCGSPYVRIEEKLTGPDANGNCVVCGKPRKQHMASQNWMAQVGQDTGALPGDEGALWCSRYKTVGWKAKCGHDAGVVPCVVLDHYGGSGTTAKVAHDNGRASISIELSAENIERQKARVGDLNLADKW